MWWFYAILSAFFAALTAVFAKIGIEKVNSDLATAIRAVIILIITWLIAYARGGLYSINTLTRTNYLFLILSGLATGLSWIFYFRALQLGKVSQVAPVDKLSVAFVVLLSALLLGETITWKIILGISLIMCGTLLLM